MAQSFLHGVETVELNAGPRPVTVVKSGVIGLIGVAPSGPVNELTVVASDAEAALFGAELPGFNIPEALAAIRAQNGGGIVLVINTFNPETNLVEVAAETLTVAAGKARLLGGPVGEVIITDNSGAVTLTRGTDYSIDAYGGVIIKNRAASGGYPDGTTLKAQYSKLDPATVTGSQLIGGIDGTTGERTGSALFELSYNMYGFNPKLLIAPGYSQLGSVAAHLLTLAKKYRGIALLDAPKATPFPAVIPGRGPVAPLGGFNTSEERAYLFYPHLKRPDVSQAAVNGVQPDKLVPLSAFMAGLIASNDAENGYWFSPSNKNIQGATGVEVQLSAAINDATTEVNRLNEAGISTVFNAFGSGLRSWGNRSAAFPSSTVPANFIAVRRTADVVEESIELNMLQYADLPLNLAGIDAVRQTVNGFLKTLVGRGALIDGECEFLAEDNPVTELAAGHVTFRYNFLPPPPMERFTFKAILDTNLLAKLVA